jgi:hypothetical protein
MQGGIHSGTGAAVEAMQWQTIELAYLGSQCTKFYAAGWMCCFLSSLYLNTCIWPDVISQWIRQMHTCTCSYSLNDASGASLKGTQLVLYGRGTSFQFDLNFSERLM